MLFLFGITCGYTFLFSIEGFEQFATLHSREHMHASAHNHSMLDGSITLMAMKIIQDILAYILSHCTFGQLSTRTVLAEMQL